MEQPKKVQISTSDAILMILFTVMAIFCFVQWLLTFDSNWIIIQLVISFISIQHSKSIKKQT